MAKAEEVKSKKLNVKSEKEAQLKEAELVVEAVPDKTKEAAVEEKSAAKAGKRSVKATKEAEAKQAKDERKAQGIQEQPKAKTVQVIKTKAERAGKKYREALKRIDKSKSYSLGDALDLATKTSPTKFDATVELHLNLGVDPKQADQNVRDIVVLPAGTGKNIRVEAISDDASAEKLFAKLDKGQIDFNVLVATPALMPKLGKYARLLGPRGLMPNPKSGTVTTDVKSAVEQAKAGRVEYRVDQSGIIHLGIGKASFGKDRLNQNAEAVLASIRAAKPASLKGIYVKSVYISSTMGPSIKVTI